MAPSSARRCGEASTRISKSEAGRMERVSVAQQRAKIAQRTPRTENEFTSSLQGMCILVISPFSAILFLYMRSARNNTSHRRATCYVELFTPPRASVRFSSSQHLRRGLKPTCSKLSDHLHTLTGHTRRYQGHLPCSLEPHNSPESNTCYILHLTYLSCWGSTLCSEEEQCGGPLTCDHSTTRPTAHTPNERI